MSEAQVMSVVADRKGATVTVKFPTIGRSMVLTPARAAQLAAVILEQAVTAGLTQEELHDASDFADSAALVAKIVGVMRV